jgi:hypothetical protein
VLSLGERAAEPAVDSGKRGEMDMANRKFVAATLVAACICNAAALADDRGTPEQRAACTPDAFRLCSNYIPDADKVEGCLRQRKLDLSVACRSVFEHRAAAASVESR